MPQLKLQWKAIGAPTVQADFGNPVAGDTAVALCVYDDGDALAGRFVVDRGSRLCGAKPCWKAKGTKGFGYQDKRTSAAGIAKLAFGSGDAGKGKADAAGANNAAKGMLSLPTGTAAALAGSSAPTVQMVTSDGFCVGATMTEVTRDGGGRFQARKK